MTHHFLLAMLTGLLAYKYDKDNEKFLRYLWIFNCILWIINTINDVVLMIGQIHGFIWEVEYIKYTDELTNAVNKYNDNLESIAQRILNLKIEFNDKDIEVRNLYGLLNKLSVVNSVKSRKETEQLLENVITEYGYMLEVFRDTGKLP